MAAPDTLGPLVEAGAPLSAQERRRYARHVALPQVGDLGQRRLREARVLVVGAGGLGSPALLYLAAAGVGTIGVVDDDRVDETNLQRQIAHGTADVGRPKTTSAAETVAALNPHVRVVEHRERLRADTAAALIAAYDLVLDGADNFGTRYLVNDACALAGIPDVWASVLAFDAQVSVWWAGHGPCYRCVFPQPPPQGSVASCSTAGVLGAVCGVAASLQVTEAVKLITGVGQPLVGRVVVHDALAGSTQALPVTQDPDCPLCGETPTIRTLTEVEDCSRPWDDVDVVEARALAALLAGGSPPVVLDVRETWERDRERIPGSVHLPLGHLSTGGYAALLHPGDAVVAVGATGARSATAARLLTAAGYPAQSLDGGLAAWVGAGQRVECGA